MLVVFIHESSGVLLSERSF